MIFLYYANKTGKQATAKGANLKNSYLGNKNIVKLVITMWVVGTGPSNSRSIIHVGKEPHRTTTISKVNHKSACRTETVNK